MSERLQQKSTLSTGQQFSATDKGYGFSPVPEASWRTYVNGILAQEISRASRYFDRIIQ